MPTYRGKPGSNKTTTGLLGRLRERCFDFRAGHELTPELTADYFSPSLNFAVFVVDVPKNLMGRVTEMNWTRDHQLFRDRGVHTFYFTKTEADRSPNFVSGAIDAAMSYLAAVAS